MKIHVYRTIIYHRTPSPAPSRNVLFLRPRPTPIPNMLGVKTIIKRHRFSSELFIDQLLSHTRGSVSKRLDEVNRVDSKTVSISLIAHSKFEWSIDISLLPVSPYMQVMLTGSLVGEPVDEPGIRVEVEDDRFVICEDGLPFLVRHAMGMMEGRD